MCGDWSANCQKALIFGAHLVDILLYLLQLPLVDLWAVLTVRLERVTNLPAGGQKEGVQRTQSIIDPS